MLKASFGTNLKRPQYPGIAKKEWKGGGQTYAIFLCFLPSSKFTVQKYKNDESKAFKISPAT